MARADIIAQGAISNATPLGAGTSYPYRAISNALYIVYIDGSLDVVYKKSTNGGLSWALPVVVHAGSATAVACWASRWSGVADGKIHVAYTDSGTDNITYRSIDTENSDTLGTAVLVFDGTSTAAGGALSITLARGGRLAVAGMIDEGAEGGFWTSVDSGANWVSKTTVWEAVTSDQIILQPGWNADNQDVMAFYWDASADEISVKRYDDSGNSWAESSVFTSMADIVASGLGFPGFAATVDLTNSRNWLVAWSAADTANADLRAAHINDTTITEVTNVVLNSVDDQWFCAMAIDTVSGQLRVVYGGKSDGSETYITALKIYTKTSDDAGSTWSAEEAMTLYARQVQWLTCTPQIAGDTFVFDWFSGSSELFVNVPLSTSPKAQYVLGI